jgi:hypothetical protein
MLETWQVHFDDKSWHGSGYAFLAESTFCCHVHTCNFERLVATCVGCEDGKFVSIH